MERIMPLNDEVTLSSEPIYEGRLVKLYKETVRLPDGSESVREVVRHPGAIAIVPVLPDGTVLLVKQFRTAAQQMMLEIPAGTLEPDEDLLVGAARELQEEIGYKPGKLEKLGAEYTAPGYTTEVIHLYLATHLEPARLDGDQDEFIEVVQMPLVEAVRGVLRGEFMDGKTQLALLLAAARLRR